MQFSKKKGKKGEETSQPESIRHVDMCRWSVCGTALDLWVDPSLQHIALPSTQPVHTCLTRAGHVVIACPFLR